MRPRQLLMAGLGVLFLGLLLVLTVDVEQARGAVVQGYLANACLYVGSGLVLLAAVVSALRSGTEAEPLGIDHYS